VRPVVVRGQGGSAILFSGVGVLRIAEIARGIAN